jgi:hypothetical protein
MQKTSHKNVTVTCAVLCIAVLACVWLRTGIVPAASGGDEVWWSESGYFFSKEGVLRWAMMDDDRGSGQMSYWPPVLPIVQAALFKLLGLTQFSMCAQSSIQITLLLVLVASLVYQRRGNLAYSLAAAVAVLGPLSTERRLVQVRMENMTAVGTLAFLWCLNCGMKCSTKRRNIYYLGSGFFLSIGIMSYYPISPFLGVAALIILAFSRDWRIIGWVILGALPVALASGAWLLVDPNKFLHQVLRAGEDHYLSELSPLTVTKTLLDWRNPVTALISWEAHVALLVGCWLSFRARNDEERRLGVLCFGMSLSFFFFPLAPTVAGVSLAIVWLFTQVSDSNRARLQDYSFKLAQSGLIIATILKVIMFSWTLVYQFQGRDYSFVENRLRSIDFDAGGVAICQRAWLALRERVAPERLHFLVYTGSSIDNMSIQLKADSAATFFDHFVIEAKLYEQMQELYPWIKTGIHNGTYRMVAEIRPPFRPLPWAKEECYHLLVYSKVSHLEVIQK